MCYKMLEVSNGLFVECRRRMFVLVMAAHGESRAVSARLYSAKYSPWLALRDRSMSWICVLLYFQW